MPQPITSDARATDDREDRSTRVSAPVLSLPTGGGAIRSIGESFRANPATGTASLTVPLAISPGRDGFGPALSLAYDSGTGNGPFGFGWTLGTPRVQRKTDRKLPRYDDGDESDTFTLSGADDLVPVLRDDGTRFETASADRQYTIHRYRPRIESAFARIERWTRAADGDVHWRSFSGANVLTIYGKDSRSRIVDPADRRRVAAWCVCEVRDDRGNAVFYEYKPEDGAGITVADAHQRNRGDARDPRRQANRYLKRVLYGNRVPLLDEAGRRPAFLSDEPPAGADWLFEVVLDYGEHDLATPLPAEGDSWTHRSDAFSNYRFGFEVRTARRCRRVLMFHHFANEPGIGRDCLVRSTDFTYTDESSPSDPRAPIHSFLRAIVERGYRRAGAGYVVRGLPPLEFEYSQPIVQDAVEDVGVESLEHLPGGLDGVSYRWADLHGDGLPGLVSEQGGAWFYKRNLSPISVNRVELGASEQVASTPNRSLADAQLVDVRGDGTLALAVLDGADQGFYARDDQQGWSDFQPFTAQLTRGTRSPNTRLVDLDGDGRADVLISEDEVFVWHASLGEEGFGPAERTVQGFDEEQAPRLVFSDPAQSIYFADFNGDGLSDIVRIRNGEVSYWPNLGYGRFGAKVAMDRAPQFDRPDQFDQRRVRLHDVDGSGPADLIYLGADGVTLYFNESGNGWSDGQRLAAFPPVDQIATIQVADLLGNGTACLVWSSPLPAAGVRTVRFVDLMGGTKPHLLVRVINNLGGETHLTYAPSTRFALADRADGRPWITKLPFPVQVVERVEVSDRISGNRFVTRYAYHHGHFDGVEREFRGFGMVEQWDTEQIDALAAGGGGNVSASSHVPPVLTRTWFHTGLHAGRDRVSNYFAGLNDSEDAGEYYREPGLSDEQAAALLLPDSELPSGLTLDEERQACRALRGVMLRKEVYALDGPPRESQPYTVTEQTFAVRLLQRQISNRHAVFFTHQREALTYNYERDPLDPRVAHTLTIDVDNFGNVLAASAIAYGRRRPDPSLSPADRDRQAADLVTHTSSAFTAAIDAVDDYRTPLPCESRRYELGGVAPLAAAPRITFQQLTDAFASAVPVAFEDSLSPPRLEKRLIAHTRTRYRPNDLGTAAGSPMALLPLGTAESLAVPGEQRTLAMTAGLVSRHFGDRVDDTRLAEAGYVHDERDEDWWQASGRTFLSPDTSDAAARELDFARRHFFHPHRFRDPFHRDGFETESVVRYDDHCLHIVETLDARGNIVSAQPDYRVLRPSLITDANGNRTAAVFDALAMVVGTAVMGKAGQDAGDSLDGFEPDLDDTVVRAHMNDPVSGPRALLQRATTRHIYDLFPAQRTASQAQPEPAAVCTLARETHAAEPGGDTSRIQQSFSYSSGLGREIQRKAIAPAAASGEAPAPARWICSGWVVHNNKDLPVRRFEPFFSPTHRYEPDHRAGVSTTSFYDPLGRLVGVLHPNHAWEKTLTFGWRGEQWDANDTVLLDPAADPDIGDHVRRLPLGDYSPTWHAARAAGGLGANEQAAASQAALHAATPSITHDDALGRTIGRVVHNRTTRSDQPDDPPRDSLQVTRSVHDVDGRQTSLVDALGRTIEQHHYSLTGARLRSIGIDTGERLVLTDVAGKVRDRWDSRGQHRRFIYDVLGRLLEERITLDDAPEIVVTRTVYGEDQPDAAENNLRGRAFQVSDPAGVVTTPAYDFKGNALVSNRHLCSDYTTTPDWSGLVPLENVIYASRSTFDALNRNVASTSADGSTVRRVYDEAGHVATVDVNIAGNTVNGDPQWRTYLAAAQYNARGERERTVLGNGIVTTRDYDPQTFRLRRLRTVGAAGTLQDCEYTYDPVGNLTRVEDAAQQTIYFRNTAVGPDREFLYDATYQLIEATGREHLGQLNGQPNPPTAPGAFQPFQTELEHPGDGRAMGRYLERYTYDAVGNLLATQHVGSDPTHPGWTRQYTYDVPGRIDPTVPGNRLARTQVGNEDAEPYTYDAHGSVTSMPHLSAMAWNDRDLLASSSSQSVTAGAPETTWYVYDSSGRRIRKVTDRPAGPGETPARRVERLYLGGSEVYREYEGDGVVVALERQTLHVGDDRGRLALVERRTVGDDGSPLELGRYQIGDHLNSVSAEVDDSGRLISYEEYFPFGATSYQAVDRTLAAAARRYRYASMERDEETGLAHHGVRYMAPWLGRWISADPAAAINLYTYADNRPLIAVDVNGAAPAYMSEQDKKWWADAMAGWEAGPLPRDSGRAGYQPTGENAWQRDATAQQVADSRQQRTIVGGATETIRPDAGTAAQTANARQPGPSWRPYDATPGAPMREVGIQRGFRAPVPEVKPWPFVDMAQDWPEVVDVDPELGRWSQRSDEIVNTRNFSLVDDMVAADAAMLGDMPLSVADDLPLGMADEAMHIVDAMDAPLPWTLLKRTGKTIFKAVPIVSAGVALTEAKAYADKGNYTAAGLTLLEEVPSPPTVAMSTGHAIADLGNIANDAFWGYVDWATTPTSHVDEELARLQMDPDELADLEAGLMEWNGEAFVYIGGERP